MDIDFVFLIMLFVFYVLSRLGGKKKPQQERPPESGTRPSRNTNPELDEALREIREALGWPAPTEPAESEPIPSSAAETRSAQEAQPQRQDRPATVPQHQPRPKKPDQFPADEENPAFARYTGVDADDVKPVKTTIPDLKSPAQTSERKVHPILEHLRSAEGARQAVVMAEIFEPRWRKLKS